MGAFSFPYMAEAVDYELVLGFCSGVSILSAVISQVYIDEEELKKNTVGNTFDADTVNPLVKESALKDSDVISF